MQTPTEVSCDNCNTDFTIKPQEKKHGNGIKETYFTCPYCDERYTAYVTDADIRRKQREIKKLYDELPKITNQVIYQQKLRVVKNKKAELEPLMNGLKNSIKQ